MEYNTQREKIKITDYGRNVHKLIAYVKTIEDRDKRNTMAEAIVETMALVNTSGKDHADFRHKLWDHLFILSDFELDVDSPFPKPEKDNSINVPSKMEYSDNNIKFRHYGKYIDAMISKAVEMQDGEEKKELIQQIAQTMKVLYLQWNNNSVADEMILNRLKEMSNDKLDDFEGLSLEDTKSINDRIAKDRQSSKKNKKKK